MNELGERLRRVISSKDLNFIELVALSGLDPAKDFRGMDLAGFDFSGCRLAGFNFSGCKNLSAANFRGAFIHGAKFELDLETLASIMDASDFREVVGDKSGTTDLTKSSKGKISTSEPGFAAPLQERRPTAFFDRYASMMMYEAVVSGDETRVKDYIEQGFSVEKPIGNDELTPLITACTKRQLGIVSLLISAGANVNSASGDEGFTPLITAVLANSIPIMESLLKVNANMEQERNDNGFTALISACALKRGSAVRVLIAAGAEVNYASRRSGWTALMAASQSGITSIVLDLLDAGADIEARRKSDGRTALMIATWVGHIHVVKSLCNFGANPSILDDNGQDAVSIAHAEGHSGIVDYLSRR